MTPLNFGLKESSFADMAVPTQCTECDLRANLWLCLTCGLANCGRKQFGGADGNSHALRHKEETGHNVAVKLGTITPEGTAGELKCPLTPFAIQRRKAKS